MRTELWVHPTGVWAQGRGEDCFGDSISLGSCRDRRYKNKKMTANLLWCMGKNKSDLGLAQCVILEIETSGE